jgi:aminoglycoside phosphotransferase (APT) family kinase protein
VALSGLPTCQEQTSAAAARDLPAAGGRGPRPGVAGDLMAARAWHLLRADAERRGRCLTGFHNRNYVLDRAGGHAALLGVDLSTPVKVRVRAAGLTVVERPWADEGAILTALHKTRLGANTPLYYDGRGDVSAHEFVPGTTLADLCPSGKPLDARYLDPLVRQLASFTTIGAAELPPLPRSWAPDGETRAFLRDRVDFAEREVRRRNWAEFAGLFGALEVPAHALRVLRDRLPALRPRPFGLVHGDLHRHNVIVRPDGELTFVDWELALWGDPLYDLAIHLVRMHYPRHQRGEVVEGWRDAVRKVRPEAAEGLDRDLPVYVAYERAQSVFADTLRIALGLGADPDPGLVGAAVSRVRNAIHLGAAPLRLNGVPTRTQVERALVGWMRARRDRAA